MIATVIRTGRHSGGDYFIEVSESPSAPSYALPVATELPLGITVEVTVKVVDVLPAPEASLIGTDVSTSSASTPVVSESPIVPKTKGAK